MTNHCWGHNGLRPMFQTNINAMCKYTTNNLYISHSMVSKIQLEKYNRYHQLTKAIGLSAYGAFNETELLLFFILSLLFNNSALRISGKEQDLCPRGWENWVLAALSDVHGSTSCVGSPWPKLNRSMAPASGCIWGWCKIYPSWSQNRDSSAQLSFTKDRTHLWLIWLSSVMFFKYISAHLNLYMIAFCDPELWKHKSKLWYWYIFFSHCWSQWGLDMARFPFFVLRYEVSLGAKTLDPILRIAAWSLNVPQPAVQIGQGIGELVTASL